MKDRLRERHAAAIAAPAPGAAESAPSERQVSAGRPAPGKNVPARDAKQASLAQGEPAGTIDLIAEGGVRVTFRDPTGRAVPVRRMLGRTPDTIEVNRPLKEGVIADYQVTQAMLRHLIKRAGGNLWTKPDVVISVPAGVTSVERFPAAHAMTFLRTSARTGANIQTQVTA